ncbi:M16 family metallopeptidase [Patescibacteria group bacterium]
MFKKTTLKNGLRIITVPQKETQAVTVLVLVGTGSKYETKETSGISHFLEHLFFKGTKKRPSTTDIVEPLDKIGGIYNAFTSQDFTGYFAKVEASKLNIALDWVSDVYLNSLLPNKEIKKEKGVIIEEINMYYDHPMTYVQVLWNKLLYGNQPAGWDVAGTKESVAKINRNQLLDYMRSQYVASNTIICLAGKMDSEKAMNKAKKYFSKIKKAKFQQKAPVIERQTKPQVLSFFKKTDQTHLVLGVRGYNIFHPQRYTQELLGVILGGMMSSRVFIRIREKMGIAYYVRTDVSQDPDTGFLTTLAGVKNKSLEKAIIAILKEYRKISQKKISTKELQKAKDYTKGKMALILESSDNLASFYGFQEVLEREILTPKEIFKKIDEISKDDIMKVAKDIFQPQKLNLALIGPIKNKEKIKKLLKL